MIRPRIIGTGSYLPERVISNREVGATLKIDPDTIFRLTGIRERRWADPAQAASDLALEAARAAMDAADLQATAIEAVVVSTTSPDMAFPSTACHLQRKLGCRSLPAFDVAASCSGFLYGLSMADAMIRSGQIKTCLVAAAEVKSRTLDLQDMETALLFGDGAGAVIVQGEEDNSCPSRGLLGFRLGADGARHDLIRIRAGGSRWPSSQDTLEAGDHSLRMQGAPLFRLAVRRLEQSVRDILKENGVELRDVAQFVVHQANGRILAQLATRLASGDRISSVIEWFGNTSSASLPIALDHSVRAGKLKPNDLVVLGSFGGGLTWASALFRW